MWLFTSLARGFDYPTHEWRLQLFRILLGTALFWKTAAIVFYGEWRRLERGGYDYFVLARQRGKAWADAVSSVFKPVMMARLFASIAVGAGVETRVALVVAAIGLLCELSYEYRFNSLYMLLCVVCLLAAGAAGHGLELSHVRSTRNTWSQFLIVLVTVDLYVNSAWLKTRSPQFFSGMILRQDTLVAAAVRHRLPRWEYKHPTFLVGIARSQRSDWVWRAMAVATIALEATIPFGLLVPATRPFAIGAGVALHAAFLGILPIRLAPFTMTTLAAYILFRP